MHAFTKEGNHSLFFACFKILRSCKAINLVVSHTALAPVKRKVQSKHGTHQQTSTIGLVIVYAAQKDGQNALFMGWAQRTASLSLVAPCFSNISLASLQSAAYASTEHQPQSSVHCHAAPQMSCTGK